MAAMKEPYSYMTIFFDIGLELWFPRASHVPPHVPKNKRLGMSVFRFSAVQEIMDKSLK